MDIVYLLANITQLYLQLSATCALFQYKIRGVKIMATVLASLVINLAMAAVSNVPLVLFFYYAGSLLFFIFIAGMKPSHGIIAALMQFVLSMVLDNVLNIPYEIMLLIFPDHVVSILARVNGLLGWLIVFLLIRRFKINLTYLLKLTSLSITLTAMLTLISVLFYVSNRVFYFTDEMTLEFRFFFIALFLALNCFSIYCVLKLGTLTTRIESLEYQKLYMETLESSVEKLRGFKHDFRNILNTLNGFVRLRNQEMLETYMQKVIQDFSMVASTDVINDTLREAPILYGIIISKLSLAELNNIQFQIRITAQNFDINTLNIVEMSRIVGILLDNALEASQKSEGKQIMLDISNVEQREEQLKIVVRNTYRGTVDMEKLYSDGYSTKDGHTGFGLYEAQRVIAKYRKRGEKVSLEASVNEKMFSQELIV